MALEGLDHFHIVFSLYFKLFLTYFYYYIYTEKSKDVDEETKIISAMSGAISLEISKIDEYTVYVEKALGNYTLYI